jgi:hypothetical protein
VRINICDVLHEKGMQDGDIVKILFSHKGTPFFSCYEGLSSQGFECYLRNMPYGEEVTISFSSNCHENALVENISFLTDKFNGLYHISGKDVLSTQLPERFVIVNEFNAYIPPFARGMGAREIEKPLALYVAPEGALIFPEHGFTSSDHFHFKNQSSYLNLLTFEIFSYLTGTAVTVPIVLNPGEEKGLSEEFFTDLWKREYQAYTTSEPPQDPQLCIAYIEQICFGYQGPKKFEY